MCSRAERKRRRRAEQPRIVEGEGSWIVYRPSRGGPVSGLQGALSTRTAPILSLPIEIIPRERAVGIAAAIGMTPEAVQETARDVAGRLPSLDDPYPWDEPKETP